MLGHAQFKAVEQIDYVFCPKVIATFIQAAVAIYLIQVAHLKLDTICSSFTGFIYHFDGTLEAAIVVITYFSNDKYSASTNFEVSYFDHHSIPLLRLFSLSRTVQDCKPSSSKLNKLILRPEVLRCVISSCLRLWGT